jgi:hypothetical protein
MFLMRNARSLVTLALLLQVACHSPTSPTDGGTQARGRLAGVVKIGPNCPVERQGQPCPTPPEAYALRKIAVYDERKSRLLYTVDIDSRGSYLIDLVPARYLIDIKGVGLDRSSDVPKVIAIQANAVTTLNISIDTGLR